MSSNLESNPGDLSLSFAEEALGAIVRSYTDVTNSAETGSKTETTHPIYSDFARKVAEGLYPDDPNRQLAFVEGADLLPTMQRQHEAAAQLQALFTGSSAELAVDSEQPHQKVRRGTGLIALISTVFIIRRSR